MFQKSYDGKPTLYLVPTPIGNMKDMTYRAVEILKSVDIIYCEDTRTSGVLLKYYEIDKKLVSLNEQNEESKIELVLQELDSNKNIALISDAGTPVISDPGYKLVREISKKYNVVCLPGATAFVPALVVSGIKPYPFIFAGFLNSSNSKRKKEIEEYKNKEETLIFYESPHRIINMLNDTKNIMGNRHIIISREISKVHEEVFRGTIEEYLSSNPTIKGEFVIVIEGKEQKKQNVDIIKEIDVYISRGYSKKDAINEVAEVFNLSKRDVYNKYHEVKK